MHRFRNRRLVRRFGQLLVGLFLYGWAMAMLVRSGLGLDPWDVFHEGITKVLPLSFGQVTIVVGLIVLLLWIPLRQKPGIGTLLNIVVIGLAADFGLWLIPAPSELTWQVALLVGGVVLNGLAGALYVGAGLGPGPRDGLWVAITARTGASIRLVRTLIEVGVMSVGWLLGGTVGVGTLVYAFAIGPLVQLFMPWVDTRAADSEIPATDAPPQRSHRHAPSQSA